MASRSESRQRSLRRCLIACKLVSLDQLQTLLECPDHVFAREELDRKGRKVIRLHMNGTKNSRRFLHVFLWWVRLLGPNYPISDNLMQANVWKHLRCTCNEGIIDTRGHRHPGSEPGHANMKVCINPRHYELDSESEVDAALREDIMVLHQTERLEPWIACNRHASVFLDEVVHFMQHHPEKDSFTALTTFIREKCK